MKIVELKFIASVWLNRELWWKLVNREVALRFKGSALGAGWSLLQPLVMLAVYTFVFSTIFKSRWSGFEEAGSTGYALNLFAGLIVYSCFAESVGGAPRLIINNKNYVTKVVFPLEVLGAAATGTAVYQAFTSVIVLLLAELIVMHKLPLSLLWLPLVWIPLALTCLAITWIVSALSVYLRDIEQVMPMLVNTLMFLSAVFYPLDALPARYQIIMKVNILANIIEQTRRILIQGSSPSIKYVFISGLISLLACEFAYRFFMKLRRGFADVL